MDKKTAVITGGSSGIGLATAIMLSRNGYEVYEMSRHDAQTNGVMHLTADVTDSVSLENAFAEVFSQSGAPDLLVCCAGFGVSGAVEFISEEDMKKQFDVNLFGTINTVKQALKYMRPAHKGRIILTSSVAAVYSIPFQAYYSASKAAINSFADALVNEVGSFGISVTAVMPGDIATGFTGARVKTPEGDVEYGGVISAAVSAMEKDEKNGMKPEEIAAFILKLAEKKKPAPLYTAGVSYKALVQLSRFLPHSFAVKIIGSMYCGKK